MKKIPALFKSPSGEASKPEPSAESVESTTKMKAALLGGIKKSLPETPETVENIAGKTISETPKSTRAKRASGVDLTPAASILGDIYKLMKQDRKDLKNNRSRIRADQKDIDSDEEKQHKQIIKALGGSTSKSKSSKNKKDKEYEEDSEDKKDKKDWSSLIGQAIGYSGVAGVVVDSKLNAPKSAQTLSPPTPGGPTPSSSVPAPAPSGGQTATPVSRGGEQSPQPSSTPSAGPASVAKQESTAPTPSGGAYGIAKASIEKHEGRRNRPYKDSKGLWTIGVGHLIGDGKTLSPDMNRDFTDKEIDDLFAKDYRDHEKAATNIPGYQNLNDNGKAALIDLTFNMGPSWYKKWPNFTEQLKSGDIDGAAKNLEGSDWYKQVGHRGPDVVNMLRAGKSAGGPATQARQESTVPAPTATATAIPAETKPSATAGTTPSTATPAGSSPPAQPSDLSSAVQVQSGVDMKGIQPTLAGRVAAAAADFKAKTGKKLIVTSGFRSNEKQKQLWDAKLAENGGNVAATRKMVAEPSAPLGNGKGSQHMLGLAIDINSKGESGLNVLAGPRNKSTGWLESFGLTRPVNNEDWHVQMTGTVATPDNPDKPGTPVTVASKDGAADPSTGEKKPEPKAAVAAAQQPAAAPKSMPAAPPVSTGTQLTAVSSENVDMKEKMAENAKTSNIVNNTVSSSAAPQPQSSTEEVENDEPSYLRKVLYG
jgi:GH24 family phage-related lysozyme (muramidase)/uncharacterized protein YcbK (DUF882 family)